MRRVVIDTNLYIDWLNAGRHEAVFFEPGVVKYLSAVVMMELLAGTNSDRDRKLLNGVTDTFGKLGRIVTPSIGIHPANSPRRIPWRLVRGDTNTFS